MNKGYNLGSLGIMDATAALTPGRVAIANEAAFGASFMSQPMTDYAVGWKTEDGALEALLEFLAPKVKVARRFEYRVANSKDQFGVVADGSDVRSLYGEFGMVKTIGEIVNAKTVSKGLTTVIEKDNEVAGEVQDKIKWLKKLLIRAEIFRATSLLASLATNTGKTWNSSAQPDLDIVNAIDAFGDAVGVDANRVLMGTTAWVKRLGAYAAQSKSAFVPPATMEGLAQFLGVEGVMGSRERYQNGSSKAKIVTSNKVFVFAGEKNCSTEDSSTLKSFWTPEVGGGEWAVYIDDVTSPKLKKITVCHTSQIAATCSTGVQSLTIS